MTHSYVTSCSCIYTYTCIMQETMLGCCVIGCCIAQRDWLLPCAMIGCCVVQQPMVGCCLYIHIYMHNPTAYQATVWHSNRSARWLFHWCNKSQLTATHCGTLQQPIQQAVRRYSNRCVWWFLPTASCLWTRWTRCCSLLRISRWVVLHIDTSCHIRMTA